MTSPDLPPPGSPRSVDLLTAPVLGGFLRWRHARSTLQALLLVTAVLVIVDGFVGPDLAPRNLAGSLPWVHWRGFVVLALLLVGNLFCFACPFMLPRRLAKLLLPADRTWPRRLRSKWLVVFLLILWFWLYEAFDLWSSPLLTAWVAVAYFVAAFVVDGIFRGASFCKHVCPIGHFQFANSLASPFEVRIRSADVCAECHTKDCITGRFESRVRTPLEEGSARTPSSWGRPTQNGCELWLFQEQKVGNMDCTFCLDCVHACPHDNVGVLSRTPGKELWEDPHRSAVGRLSKRPDLAALVTILTFGALVNAFGTVTPVYALEAWLAQVLGTRSPALVTAVLFLAGFVVIPFFVVGATALASRALSGTKNPLRIVSTRYAYSLVPVGLGVWVAHYLHHFLLSALTVIPVAQSRLQGMGIGVLGEPRWSWSALLPESWILPVEIVCVEVGMLLSLLVAFRIAKREHGAESTAVRAFLPWGVLVVALSFTALWILFQPMEMRTGL